MCLPAGRQGLLNAEWELGNPHSEFRNHEWEAT